MLLIEEFNIVNGQMKVVFEEDDELKESLISIRLRDNDRFVLLEHNQEFNIKPELINNRYELTIDLKSFVQQFYNLEGNKNIIDLYIKNDNGYEKIKIKREQLVEQVESIETIRLNDLIELKPYITTDNSLAFKLIQRKVLSFITDIIKDSEGNFEIQIETKVDDKEDFAAIDKVLLARRVFKDSTIIAKRNNLKKKNANSFVLTKEDFLGFSFDSKTIFDLIVRYRQDNVIVDSALKIESLNIDAKIDLEDYLDARLYVNKGKGLSIKIERSYPTIRMENINIDNHIINFDIDFSKLLNKDSINNDQVQTTLQIYKYFNFSKDEELYIYRNISTEIKEDLIGRYTLDVAQLFGDLKSNYNHTFTLFLSITTEKDKTDYRLICEENKTYDFKTTNANIKYDVDNKQVNFCISPVNVNPVSIGVLGSCFSRSAFDSHNEYFNPDYKKYFKVTVSHFWYSVISGASEPIPFDKSEFQDMSEKELADIEKEFLKNTFELLKKEKIDFIIIDFYNDAMHGVLKLDDGKIIARNPNLRKSKYYVQNIMNNSSNIDYRSSDYFELWKECCDRFISKLITIVPEDKIILNISKLTDKYIDENHNTQSFAKNKKFTKAKISYYNYVWTKMDNYFLNKLPNAQIIDLNKYSFASSINHPASCGPHHFVSDYYKQFIDELAKVVIFTK